MDSITVYKDGAKILVFYDDPAIMGSSSENSLNTKDFYKFAPVTVVNCFKCWEKYSTQDGTNPTMEIKFDEIEYIFVNHYWD